MKTKFFKSNSGCLTNVDRTLAGLNKANKLIKKNFNSVVNDFNHGVKFSVGLEPNVHGLDNVLNEIVLTYENECDAFKFWVSVTDDRNYEVIDCTEELGSFIKNIESELSKVDKSVDDWETNLVLISIALAKACNKVFIRCTKVK